MILQRKIISHNDQLRSAIFNRYWLSNRQLATPNLIFFLLRIKSHHRILQQSVDQTPLFTVHCSRATNDFQFYELCNDVERQWK
ncbi:hypothetical protein T4C_6034 [Trichinella pseudospiralis]|uniref:Uncharacterized protein n=1 Tax=Trichinella pseudospiralis TaxID=6337 RepID=A0A0V1IRT2_TRIPS|nr:hypothetical protein T4C_6034 [Trichinella pseudospiralis]